MFSGAYFDLASYLGFYVDFNLGFYVENKISKMGK